MKSKGTRAERELLHLFWQNNWACMRSAGSGNTTMPSPDLIAGNKNNLLAIECKSTKGNSRNLQKEEIEQLVEFSDKIAAIPILAMRFDKNGWSFLNAKKTPKNKKGNYTISLKLCKEKGINFQELIGKYKQAKL
jgi:holliday junction resolvase Hjr